jgi:phage terminase large subunit-like protein
MTRRLNRYPRDPVAFIDDLVKKNELGQPFRLLGHQREILRLAFAFDSDGRLPYDTIIYSCPKKSGKTTLNAAVTLWWAFTQEAPNEILIIANDLEQAQGRVFKAIAGIIQHNPELARSAEVQAKQIILSNGTTIIALASEYAGAAGSNHGLTSWDELWGYSSESSRRLWEELTPVPTRKNSIRFITTYAGWENESALLSDLYKQGVGKDEYHEGRGERIHPNLPIYINKESRLFVYWDHEPRMPWQTKAYYDSQRRTLRPGTYLRLHENRWATAESTFITPELWDPCVDPGLSPLLPTNEHQIFVGVDAGIKHDNAAVVAVRWDDDKLALVSHRIWRPTPTEPLDLEGTIEEHLRELHDRYSVAEILCDPYQLHRSITTLQGAGLPIKEFPQSTVNTTRMGQVLFDLLNGKNLRIYSAGDLRQQALNTVAIEGSRGFRIAKEKTSKKIDAIVALAMACISAVEVGRPVGSVDDIVLFGDRITASPDALFLWPRRNWIDDF